MVRKVLSPHGLRTMPESETETFHDARYFPIRLAYLYDSELNDTVDWAWEASERGPGPGDAES